jgi:hypothetical protein
LARTRRPSRFPLDADRTPPLTDQTRPSAAAVLRRSLLVWGWGLAALGNRRGWALAVLQVCLVAVLLVVALQLIDGTSWLVVLVPLAVLLVAWLGQALDAYQRALRSGAAEGGEVQVVLFVPLAVTLLTVYWLLGGSHGSPSATTEQYALDWMSMRSADATQLFVGRPDAARLATTWQTETAFLEGRVAAAAEEYGPASGLHAETPFDNLRFGTPTMEGPDSAQVTIDIVRQEEVQTTILGFIPTASQETVTVERAGVISLRLVPVAAPDWLGIGGIDSSQWLIESVSMGPPTTL